MAGMRLIMRVPRIGVHRDNRRIIRQQVLPRKRFHKPLLDLMLFRPAIANALANLLERLTDDRIDAVPRGEVGRDLLLVPGRFELRHQIGGTDDILSQPPQQIDRAAIH